jgi:hypothetical protein
MREASIGGRFLSLISLKTQRGLGDDERARNTARAKHRLPMRKIGKHYVPIDRQNCAAIARKQ